MPKRSPFDKKRKSSQDVEREKYLDLLKKYQALETEHESVRASFEAKEEECLTISSFSQI